MAYISDENRDRIYELAEEYGVHPSIVRSLYDVMPNELYDGVVNALEDLTEDSEWEDFIR